MEAALNDKPETVSRANCHPMPWNSRKPAVVVTKLLVQVCFVVFDKMTGLLIRAGIYFIHEIKTNTPYFFFKVYRKKTVKKYSELQIQSDMK